MKTIDPETIRSEVRRRYGAVARGSSDLSSDPKSRSCCGGSTASGDHTACGCGCSADEQALTLGYSPSDLAAVPDGANLGLGCGNPVAIASLQPGQTVVDLGAGAGFDAFLAARAVGPTGRVIGVDMTPDMVAKARQNAQKAGLNNIEFRLGEIEALPIADGIVDVIISNCVINLCPDKRPVYQEAFRILKPNGRIAVSDVVAHGELSEEAKTNLELLGGCVAGATPEADLLKILQDCGFVDIEVRRRGNSEEVIGSWDHKTGFEKQVFAAEVIARKPEKG